jgi:hypothetical protein
MKKQRKHYTPEQREILCSILELLEACALAGVGKLFRCSAGIGLEPAPETAADSVPVFIAALPALPGGS